MKTIGKSLLAVTTFLNTSVLTYIWSQPSQLSDKSWFGRKGNYLSNFLTGKTWGRPTSPVCTVRRNNPSKERQEELLRVTVTPTAHARSGWGVVASIHLTLICSRAYVRFIYSFCDLFIEAFSNLES